MRKLKHLVSFNRILFGIANDLTVWWVDLGSLEEWEKAPTLFNIIQLVKHDSTLVALRDDGFMYINFGGKEWDSLYPLFPGSAL